MYSYLTAQLRDKVNYLISIEKCIRKSWAILHGHHETHGRLSLHSGEGRKALNIPRQRVKTIFFLIGMWGYVKRSGSFVFISVSQVCTLTGYNNSLSIMLLWKSELT
jgi:hypothetical protein